VCGRAERQPTAGPIVARTVARMIAIVARTVAPIVARMIASVRPHAAVAR
jgi:hypothetical protein